MPRIPRYTRQVEPGAMPVPGTGPQATALGPEAFGGGLAKGMDVAARAGFAVLEEERKNVDRSMLLGGKTSLDQLEVDLLYDPTQGAVTKKGKDSFGIDAPTLEAYDTGASKIEEGLGSDAQKEAFRQIAAEKRVGVSKILQRHIYGETNAYAAEQNKAALESTVNAVALNFQDPARVDQERRFGEGTILSDPAMRGLPPEAKKLRMEKWNSVVFSTVVDKLMIEDPVGAKRYYDAKKDAITSDDQARIEKALIPLAAQKRGFDFAVGVTSTNPTATKDELLAKAQGELGQDVRAYEHAKSEIGSILEARESARRARVDQARNGVYGPVAEMVSAGQTPKWDAIPIEKRVALLREDPGEADRIQESLKRSGREEAIASVMDPIVRAEEAGRVAKIGDVPAGAWESLRKADPVLADKVLDELRAEGQHASDRVRTLADRPTDDQLTTWGQLKLDPALLTRTNLDALLVHKGLTRTAYADLITDQLALQKDKTGEKEGAILSTKEVVNDVLNAAGFSEKEHPKQYALFWEQLELRRKGFMAENKGEQPTQEQTRQFTRELLSKLPAYAFGGWFSGKESFQVPAEKLRVPPAEREKIEASLRTAGQAVSDAAVVDLYRRKLEREGVKK